jgi:hypothetical protein
VRPGSYEHRIQQRLGRRRAAQQGIFRDVALLRLLVFFKVSTQQNLVSTPLFGLRSRLPLYLSGSSSMDLACVYFDEVEGIRLIALRRSSDSSSAPQTATTRSDLLLDSPRPLRTPTDHLTRNKHSKALRNGRVRPVGREQGAAHRYRVGTEEGVCLLAQLQGELTPHPHSSR